MRNNNGITLISLVITIVVLIILAGVTIAMLTGENGIVTKANQADLVSLKAEVIEKVNMELTAQYTNALAGDDFDTQSEIQANLSDIKDYITVAVNSKTSVTITINETALGTAGTEYALTNANGTIDKTGTNNTWKLTTVK